MTCYSYSVVHKNGWGTECGPRPTHCANCGAALPAPVKGDISNGYGCDAGERALDYSGFTVILKPSEYVRRSRAHCYACCAATERAAMIENGRATLYLTTEQATGRGLLTDWPGKLVFRGGVVRKGRHNMARVRYDVWFTGPDNKPWHAVQYGDNTQIAHARRVQS